MKGKTLLGALLVSVALSSQAFGFELLDRMLGLNRGCGACDPCGEAACCEPATNCCAPEPACCEEPARCEEPACCEEPASCEPSCAKPCCKRSCCDLFAGLKGLFDCGRGCKKSCCEEPQCCEEPECCAPEPECCEPACGKSKCSKPRIFKSLCRKKSCCEEPACCEEPECGSCRKKSRCGKGLLDFLGGLFKCGHSCKKTSCGEEVCYDDGCGGCGGGEAAAPAEAPDEEAAPLPKAPVADPSASIQRYYRGIVRN